MTNLSSGFSFYVQNLISGQRVELEAWKGWFRFQKPGVKNAEGNWVWNSLSVTCWFVSPHCHREKSSYVSPIRVPAESNNFLWQKHGNAFWEGTLFDLLITSTIGKKWREVERLLGKAATHSLHQGDRSLSNACWCSITHFFSFFMKKDLIGSVFVSEGKENRRQIWYKWDPMHQNILMKRMTGKVICYSATHTFVITLRVKHRHWTLRSCKH